MRPRPLSIAKTGRPEVCFQVRDIDHHGLLFAVFAGQPGHDPRKNAPFAPPIPAIVQRLVYAVLLGRVPPPQAIVIDEDISASHAPIIDARLAVRPGEVGLQARHLRICQPVRI